ncbi:MAG TPA: glycosyltransferase family 4 protein [Pyrinomonadaceae bacterium]|nr:glycosyltransferase family 4 protein [Pyrinomonadaceae bacterium]
MRILQISSAQSLGGGERHLADLANGLARRGHDVYVALRPKSPLIKELAGLANEKITTLPLRNSLDAISARDLSRLVRRNKIQIVHAHMARDYPLAAYAARANAASKLIITRHVLFPLSRLHRITLSRAARIIAVSHAVASRLKADAIVPAEKISVILNGIDTARFSKARSEFDRRQFFGSWKLPADSLLVGTVGELTPLKGQEEILRAASQLLKQLPEIHFIIAGVDHSRENQHRTRLEDLIKELDLTTHVSLVGWLDDLAELYCGSDVFVSASHTESFGLAIAEAMASGTAVVATGTEGASELIKTGETGSLVPIGNVVKLAESILLLLRDKEERIRLGRAAQQAAAANFGLERMIAETEAMYRTEVEEGLT